MQRGRCLAGIDGTEWGMTYCPQPHLWLGRHLKAVAGELHKGSHLEVSPSSVSPGRGPGVGLCDASPKGGSAYSLGGSRRHQLVPGGAEPPAGRA